MESTLGTPPRPTSAGTASSNSPGAAGNSPSPQPLQTRKRSGSGGGILSRLPFMRTTESKSNLKESRHVDVAEDALHRSPRALAPPESNGHQPAKTRRRRGSLRKVALLGRGMQRERRELRPIIPMDNTSTHAGAVTPALGVQTGTDGAAAEAAEIVSSPVSMDSPGIGLGISDDNTPRASVDGFMRRSDILERPPPRPEPEPQATSPTISYTSTEDEEDGISLKQYAPSPLRPGLTGHSSGSESYFKPARAPSLSLQRRRSVKHTKSPLSLSGLTASPLPAPPEEFDYSETEWWGWVILIVTWIVFVIGMGSCFGVWSWAWDVGTTPYAPPELEDDPTLPITGYYPSLMILTCIMAWVWVVTAWVGMKYFRHAKISGD
ncbi:hypothetical protein PFICI_12084 [Pestalotiopsis fici W106-1]|uniref:Uncharacterized protein n=1 Tax=Pestalotiopsis fici (strain W106-1 / CGMCC3.15140) TaxID=1229662 RepID=W3WU81_PESFW|nr:uncharacterized protein PFICI_12084 [Pestalotiopsis fici W106-1]ETS76697.1 hypothetical protein PFICI_12084 [Pestalotiopsis fici W106-1]